MATVSERIERAERLADTYTDWAQTTCDEAMAYRFMGEPIKAQERDDAAKGHAERAQLQRAVAQTLSMAASNR